MNETAVRTGHISDHLTRNFCRFGSDGSGLSAGNGSAAVVGVAAGGDEESEMKQSEYRELAVPKKKQQQGNLMNKGMGTEKRISKRNKRRMQAYKTIEAIEAPTAITTPLWCKALIY